MVHNANNYVTVLSTVEWNICHRCDKWMSLLPPKLNVASFPGWWSFQLHTFSYCKWHKARLGPGNEARLNKHCRLFTNPASYTYILSTSEQYASVVKELFGLYLIKSDIYWYILWAECWSCLHTTVASLSSQELSQIVPHGSFWQISTRPSYWVDPPAILICPP